jgi:formylmethanofuran dehydrogenase subunit A
MKPLCIKFKLNSRCKINNVPITNPDEVIVNDYEKKITYLDYTISFQDFYNLNNELIESVKQNFLKGKSLNAKNYSTEPTFDRTKF